MYVLPSENTQQTGGNGDTANKFRCFILESTCAQFQHRKLTWEWMPEQISYQPSCSKVSDTDPLALGTPQCLQEGEKPGGWTPTHCPRECNRSGRLLMMRKILTNRIKTDSSHTVKGQKERGKRSIWSETTVLIVSCWPFVGLQSKTPEDGPVLLHGVAPGGETGPV